MAGLFDTFTVAKRGLSVQQGAINTTSHNIANANTVGYSRQRAVAQTTRPFGGTSKFDSVSVGQVGTGAEISSIMRIRDSFLDYQVRTESTNYGTVDVKNQYLYQIEDILNETTSTGVQGALSAFYNAFQELAKSPEKESNRTVALQQAAALADTLNSRYNQLENKKNDAQKELGEYVTEINDMLDQINELNKQISSVSSVGMTPNDLMDSRDYLIDQLSTKFGVKIDKQSYDTINLSVTEDGKIGNLVSSKSTDTNYSRFSYVENATINKDTGNLEITYSVLGDKNNQKKIEISGDADELNTLRENLLEDRILVGDKDGIVNLKANIADTDYIKEDANGTLKVTLDQFNSNDDNSSVIFNNVTKGEIAGNQQVQDDIQKYMDELDKFTASFAYAVNAIQTGSIENGKSGIEGLDDADAQLMFVVKGEDGSISNSDTGITAKNITINTVLQKDTSLLNCGEKHVDDVSGDKDGTRALAIADLKNLKIDIGSLTAEDIADRESFFKDPTTGGTGTSGIKFSDGSNMNLSNDKGGSGTKLDEYYKSIISDLATTSKAAQTAVTNQSTILQALDTQRLSVSGVSLDEEMTDLIQFQHSYQANAKMINTVDELLDVVINGLKR